MEGGGGVRNSFVVASWYFCPLQKNILADYLQYYRRCSICFTGLEKGFHSSTVCFALLLLTGKQDINIFRTLFTSMCPLIYCYLIGGVEDRVFV